MNKIILLIASLNECDFELLFKEKNITILYDEEEIVTWELPIGTDTYAEFIKLMRNAVIDQIDFIEEQDLSMREHKEMLNKLNNIKKCLIC